jgi:AcrR family transcriptional regulator
MNNYFIDAASTRDKILNATLGIMAKEGFQSITIKKIADSADVNIAAVNYHFGSKTNVINEAVKVLNGKRTRCFEVLEQKEIPPLERLKRFLYGYLESALEHPDVFKSFIHSAINNHLDRSHNIILLKEKNVEKIKAILNEGGIHLDDDVLMMKLVQIVGCMQLPILLGENMEQMSGINFNEDAVRNKYVDLMIQTLLKE